MVELTQQAEFESMIKFNASTGEEYCDMIDLSVVSVVPKSLSDIKQVGFTVPLFSSRDVYSEWK